jgi:hypothetical protein
MMNGKSVDVIPQYRHVGEVCQLTQRNDVLNVDRCRNDDNVVGDATLTSTNSSTMSVAQQRLKAT